MTQEEKARAYDEALERARRIKNGEDNWRYSDLTEIIPAIEEVLPELAESEDEQALRIIKKLMCYDPVPISDEDRRIVENWLEKQKERNLIMAKSPQLKEQKPVVTHGETYHVDTIGTQQTIAGKMPQKPAEWSEEDEDNIDCVIDLLYILDSYIGDDCTISQEKTEESRIKIQKVICPWLKSLKNRGNSPKSSTNSPSWKPSEEQMKALLNAEGFLRAGLQYDSAKTIAELYEHLKKL